MSLAAAGGKPMIYLLGARVHEWHLGAVLLLALTLGAGLDLVDPSPVTATAVLLGIWLVAKDWRDLVPSQRDTAHWRLGLHGRPAPLRAVRRADPLPKLAALGTALAGFVNLASAVTPNIGWRDHLLLRFAPFEAMRLSHAVAVPASLLLFVTAPYLWRKREGALRLTIALLLGLGVLDVLKGLDVEEAGVSFGGAALLWLGRESFCVLPDPVSLRAALSRVPLVAGCGLLLCSFAVWLAAPESASLGAVVRETMAALLWQPGPARLPR
jgi:lysyl-tRNA synthetase, class II